MPFLHTQLNTWHHKYICIPQKQKSTARENKHSIYEWEQLGAQGGVIQTDRQADTRDEMLSRKIISCTGWKKQQIHEHSIPSSVNYDHSRFQQVLGQWRKSFFLLFLFLITGTLIPKISKFYIIWISIHLHVYISLWKNSASLFMVFFFYHF